MGFHPIFEKTPHEALASLACATLRLRFGFGRLRKATHPPLCVRDLRSFPMFSLYTILFLDFPPILFLNLQENKSKLTELFFRLPATRAPTEGRLRESLALPVVGYARLRLHLSNSSAFLFPRWPPAEFQF